MTTNTDVHTCSYYCERPECVRRQRDELRDRMESALAQQPAETSNAREWVLVPREPTQAMLEAFNDWRPTEGSNYAGGQSVSAQVRWEFRQRYAAMLASAPPSAPVGVEGFEQWYARVDARFWNNWDACNAAFHAGKRAALTQQPAARGVVDDAMVDRAGQALYGTDWGSFDGWEADQLRRKVRAVLTAALQQGGA